MPASACTATDGGQVAGRSILFFVSLAQPPGLDLALKEWVYIYGYRIIFTKHDNVPVSSRQGRLPCNEFIYRIHLMNNSAPM